MSTVTVECLDPVSLAPLRGSKNLTGYRGVYLTRNNRDGVPVYCAKVKRGRRLMRLGGSASTDPRDCARHVARWYQREYGDDWPAVLAARKVNPWRVKKNQEGKGFYAIVWIRGKRHEVVPLVWSPLCPAQWERQADRQVMFPTREAARAGLWAYAVRWLGLDGLPPEMVRDEMVLSLYRTEPPRRAFLGRQQAG